MAKLVLALIEIDGGDQLLSGNFSIYKASWQRGRSQNGIAREMSKSKKRVWKLVFFRVKEDGGLLCQKKRVLDSGRRRRRKRLDEEKKTKESANKTWRKT